MTIYPMPRAIYARPDIRSLLCLAAECRRTGDLGSAHALEADAVRLTRSAMRLALEAGR